VDSPWKALPGVIDVRVPGPTARNWLPQPSAKCITGHAFFHASSTAPIPETTEGAVVEGWETQLGIE